MDVMSGLHTSCHGQQCLDLLLQSIEEAHVGPCTCFLVLPSGATASLTWLKGRAMEQESFWLKKAGNVAMLLLQEEEVVQMVRWPGPGASRTLPATMPSAPERASRVFGS